MKFRYRIKIRYYHERCTRFYVQKRFLFWWYTPNDIGDRLNAAISLEDALEFIDRNERNELYGELENFKNKMRDKHAVIVEV